MASARSTYQTQENQLFNSPGYTNELQHPGYTTAEANALNSATNQTIAGENANVQNLARQHAVLTGNAAGLTTALQRMQDTAGQQAALQAARNQGTIANARIRGTQNALEGISRNQQVAVGDEQRQAQTGFWNNFTSALGKSLGEIPGKIKGNLGGGVSYNG